MKKQKYLPELLPMAKAASRAVRSAFLVVLVLSVLAAVSPRQKQYTVPTSVATPVIFHNFESDHVENSALKDSETIYCHAEDTSYVPQISARAASVMDVRSRTMIYGKNSDVFLPMASTTKIMTALVVLESCDLDAVFTVPASCCGVEGSSIYLVPGERITVRDLLYGLMLESGNDAAEALATACAGSVENFVILMNKKAAELGLERTFFANPHGLSAQGHGTTAYELSKLACHAMNNPEFKKIVGTKSHTVTAPDGTPTHYFSNHNRLLHSYPGAVGVKTGYTIASGRCLVSCAERSGDIYVTVTLDDRNDWRDHALLLDYAFSVYTFRELIGTGTLKGTFGGREYRNNSSHGILTRRDGDEADEFEITVVMEGR